jgi:hypothetical protein
MSSELVAVERDITRIAQIVGARGPEIPTVGFSSQTGLPCVLEQDGVFVWLTMDSGREVSREKLDSRDEVLYRALDSMVYSAASRYATDHAVAGVPFWAVLLRRELELVRSVDRRWYVRACAEAVDRIERNTADGGLGGYVSELLARAREVVREGDTPRA